MSSIVTSLRPSDFHATIANRYGQYTGVQIADAAVNGLGEMGIDPAELKPIPVKANNTILFITDDALAIKIINELEHHQTLPEKDRAVLGRLASRNIGFDMGDVAISLVVTPYLNASGVSRQHVKALCHELYGRGKLFYDNKSTNVALTRDNVPYVIDEGAVMPLINLSPAERKKAFSYPELSGFDASTHSWDTEAARHPYHWPANQQDVPEFREAASTLAARKSAASSLVR